MFLSILPKGAESLLFPAAVTLTSPQPVIDE